VILFWEIIHNGLFLEKFRILLLFDLLLIFQFKHFFIIIKKCLLFMNMKLSGKKTSVLAFPSSPSSAYSSASPCSSSALSSSPSSPSPSVFFTLSGSSSCGSPSFSPSSSFSAPLSSSEIYFFPFFAFFSFGLILANFLGFYG